MRRAISLLLFLLLAPRVFAAGLEARETLWGFDGQVVSGRINPVSVLLVNTSNEPFDGDVVLFKTMGMGGRVGENFVQRCAVSPRGESWVKFFVHTDGNDTWELRWGGGKNQGTVSSPRMGAPARVMLTNRDDSGAAGIKTFPENLFPTTVAATDGLESVAMDHAPRLWTAAQKEALVDWVRRGGTLHICWDANGNYPTFTGDLSPLESPLETMRLGAGLVVRHPVMRLQLNSEYLANRGFPHLEQKNNEYPWRVEYSAFQRLSSFTRPNFNWWVIFLIAVIYVLVIGPGNFLLGRKATDYRMPILFFLVTVALFGFFFHFIGRRGYGENNSAHTMAYARALDDGNWDVAQWSHVFVTRGSRYTLNHDSTHNLYSSCQEQEAVNGVAQNGINGFFNVEMPVFSSRTLLHRAKMKGDRLGLRPLNWHANDVALAQDFKITVGPDFPKGVVEAWAYYNQTFFPLRLNNGVLERDPNRAGDPSTQFLSRENTHYDGYYGNMYPVSFLGISSGEEKENPVETFKSMTRMLIARALSVTDIYGQNVTIPKLPDDRLDLFIFAPSPDNFRFLEKTIRQQTGYVLYHVSLFQPE